MKKRFLKIGLALSLLTLLVLLYPTNYKIEVHSSRYFEECGQLSTSQNKCIKYEPPRVINKRKANVLAKLEQLKIERQFAKDEVSTHSSESSGQGSEGVLVVLAALLPLSLFAGLIYVFVISIKKALQLKDTEKIAWLCLIIFLFPFGSIIFLVVKPKVK